MNTLEKYASKRRLVAAFRKHAELNKEAIWPFLAAAGAAVPVGKWLGKGLAKAIHGKAPTYDKSGIPTSWAKPAKPTNTFKPPIQSPSSISVNKVDRAYNLATR